MVFFGTSTTLTRSSRRANESGTKDVNFSRFFVVERLDAGVAVTCDQRGTSELPGIGMDPYAKPGERRTGENRPQIPHRAPDPRRHINPRERLAEKEQVAAERRAIKKSARRHLKKQLDADLNEFTP